MTFVRKHLALSFALVIAALSVAAGACSSTAGTPGPGGGSGGSSAGSGGTTLSGTAGAGAAPTGAGGTVTGGSGKGGTAAGPAGGSSGAAGMAGTTATGGSAAGGAGRAGTSGGAAGASAGGARAGSSGAGGSAGSNAGAGGASAGGAAGAQAARSAGCGSSNPLKTSNALTETINGVTRKWMLDVPTNYDTNQAYRLIFVWHPLGGSGSQVVSGGYNGLKSMSNGSAIFATADGLNGSNSEASGTGWWNVNGGDMKLLQTMLDKINGGLCVDQQRIFSTGFSFGGMMSYTVPFQFNVFRAVAPCSGKEGVIPYDNKYSDPMPIMAFHGDADTFVLTSLGKAFFDKFAARNKCGTQTQPVSPNGCVQYQGCVAPTIWCLFPGGHTTWSEEPAAIWKFFSQF